MARVYRLVGTIYSDFSGYKVIVGLYDFCRDLTDETIALYFYDCEWFDANLSALLQATIHKLVVEQRLAFTADFDFLKSRFNVLFRNRFLNDGNDHPDDHQSTVALASFSVNDKDAFN